jgi:hypothetical protein
MRVAVSNAHVVGRGRMSFNPSNTGNTRTFWGSRAGLIEPGVGQREAFSKDLAAVPVIESPVPGIERKVLAEDLRPGDALFTLGNTAGAAFIPRGGRYIGLLDRGDLSQRREMEAILRALEGSNELAGLRSRYNRLLFATNISEPGFSGAPVVDRHARLAGVIVGGNAEISIIIPVEDVYRLAGRGYISTSPERIGGASPAGSASGGDLSGPAALRARIQAASGAAAPESTADPAPVVTRLARMQPLPELSGHRRLRVLLPHAELAATHRLETDPPCPGAPSGGFPVLVALDAGDISDAVTAAVVAPDPEDPGASLLTLPAGCPEAPRSLRFLVRGEAAITVLPAM